MRKLFVIMTMAAFTLLSYAQVTNTVSQSAAALEKAKEAVKERASKDAKKQAKSMTKEGWKVTPGKLPLEKQFDRSFQLEYVMDEEGQNVYVTGEGMSVAQTYDVARKQADFMAKGSIAGQIQTRYTSLAEGKFANEQLSQAQANSVSRFLEDNRLLVEENLGKVTPMVECYRETKDGNVEVLVRYAYNPYTTSMLNAIKSNLLKSLEDDPETAKIVEKVFEL